MLSSYKMNNLELKTDSFQICFNFELDILIDDPPKNCENKQWLTVQAVPTEMHLKPYRLVDTSTNNDPLMASY